MATIKTTYQLHALQKVIDNRLRDWEKLKLIPRLWEKDPSVWTAGTASEITNRLGWLTLPTSGEGDCRDYGAFATEILREKISSIVLLGMGGSSMAPEVLMAVIGTGRGFPPLRVIDTTHPESIQRHEKAIDLLRTLFVVSSKSGSTVETLSLFRYFFDKLGSVTDTPGEQFVVITDPGSKLQSVAEKYGLRRTFASSPNVGGRFSALSAFGLVPAALIGVDVVALLAGARGMQESCGADKPVADNPGAQLGAFLGELANAGRDKILVTASPQLAPFGAWLEQLLAESSGKGGKGILPIFEIGGTGSPTAVDMEACADVAHLLLTVHGDNSAAVEKRWQRLQQQKIPAAHLHLDTPLALGALFYLCEFATATAGAVLQVNPFDQPDVELAKEKARALTEITGAASDKPTATPPELKPLLKSDAFELYGDPRLLAAPPAKSFIKEAEAWPVLQGYLKGFMQQTGKHDYIGLLGYLSPTQAVKGNLTKLAAALQKGGRPVTINWGPRYLHSSGQLHKGDGNQGLFWVLSDNIDDPALNELLIPGEAFDFAMLLQAQAQGDYLALQERQRRVVHLVLKGDIGKRLQQLTELLG